MFTRLSSLFRALSKRSDLETNLSVVLNSLESIYITACQFQK